MTKISHGAYRFRPGIILAALQGCIRTPFVRLPAYGYYAAGRAAVSGVYWWAVYIFTTRF